MIDAISFHALFRPTHVAVVDLETDRSFSYRALDRVVDQCAHWLVDKLGAKSGKRVAIVAKNCVEILFLQLACERAGAIFVPLNWRLSAAELAGILANADPALVLKGKGIETALEGHHGEMLSLSAAVDAAIAEDHQPSDPAWRAAWDAPSTLLYTSGTSGHPKGVRLSQKNIFWSGTNYIHGNEVSTDNVFLCDLPMFHTAGLIAAVRSPLLAGGRVLISDGFDPKRTLARIADPALGITNYFSVPQMAQMMWNQPGFELSMLSSLKTYTTGGAPNPKVMIERFVGAGIMMSDGFGMTEVGSAFGMPTYSREVILGKAGSCGVPLMSIEPKIVDPDGNEVPTGEAGELWIKGPSVTDGYWENPEATAGAFHDGWFKTGDMVKRDADGFFYLVDRKKDMFISGGENVYPAEVEAAILAMPEIAEVAVIGVPDEKWGEVGCAFYVWVDGKELTAESIKDTCGQKLAKYKVPKHYRAVTALPRTGSGKVKKHELQHLWRQSGGSDS
ncbi:AMP-binding protein [Kordiimonas marina]|uniref:AMP-binding protein n=1 Tax=Kordiimonas marina TaxID=2872312 RepID=UPI001FF39185|nr:AMP-binding protein [Kordiimonas marina]MCJ9427782.1 AMP-binding protein [Kordiimonas marina]